MAVAEFDRWFDKRLARTVRAVRRLERLRRRRRIRVVLGALSVGFFLVFSAAGYVSELARAYWGPFR